MTLADHVRLHAPLQACLQALTGEKPVLNQCSMSLKKHDDTTIAYCRKNSIVYEAFGAIRRLAVLQIPHPPRPVLLQHLSKWKGVQQRQFDATPAPTGVMRGCPFTDPKVTAIASAHSVTAAQICVRWTLQVRVRPPVLLRAPHATSTRQRRVGLQHATRCCC